MATHTAVPAAPPSRREREKLARQQDILASAQLLFVQKGYQETTLDDIARHAGFGKGTIYNYFSSKDELFKAIIDSLVEQTIGRAEEALRTTGGTVRERLAAYVYSVIQYWDHNILLFDLIRREAAQIPFHEMEKKQLRFHSNLLKIRRFIAELLQEEIRHGRIKPFDTHRMAQIITGLVTALLMDRMASLDRIRIAGGQKDDPEELREMVEMVITIFFDGIAERKRKG